MRPIAYHLGFLVPAILILASGRLAAAEETDDEQPVNPPPADFAERWAAGISNADEGALRRLLVTGARLAFESAGRNRIVATSEYASLLAAARSGFKHFERSVGSQEVTHDGGKVRLVFTTTDRIRIPQGYVLEAVNREEFEFPREDTSRATVYRSRTLSCEALEKPEAWMNYGGPAGLNGFLIEAQYQSAPSGMTWVFVGAALAIGLLLKALHSLGIRRRF